MTNQQFNDILIKYIEQQLHDIEKVKGFNVVDFKCLDISCKDINHAAESWCKELQASGVSRFTPVLYYFKIKNETKEILKKVINLKKFKITSGKYKALPKINNLEANNVSNILYVGKTNSNFISRFKYHLGLGSSKTYSLQLLHWACELNLELVLYYSIMSLPKNEIKYLEQLESALHLSLKPVLGRAGH